MAEEKSAEKSTKPKTSPEKVEKETKTSESVKKSHKNWLWGIIGGVAAIAIIAVVAVVLNLKPGAPDDPTKRLTYSTAFFINDGGYTLWNSEGKRLTEDVYSETSNFVGGYSYVKKDSQVGIIRDDGKTTVEFGKYGNITQKGGLYLAQDGNTKEYQLITGSGSVLARGSELNVFYSVYTAGAAAVKTEGKILLFNYAGKLIAEAPVADDASDPVLNTSTDFGIMYYANRNYVFDARDGKMVANFEGERYSFEEVSDDRAKILLENYSDNNKYKLIVDGKIYDLNEMKYYSFTAQNLLIGYDDMTELALLDNNYQVIKKVSDYIQLKDSYNYAAENGDKVEIYKNGEKIKEFENTEVSASGILYEDYYALETDGKAMFYNLDGSVAINHEYKKIKTLFDRHHHAVVSDDGEEYYLIDARGNRITEYTATYFAVREGGYEVENKDDKYAIANKSGQLVSDFSYEDTYYRSYAEPRNIWTGEKGRNSYDVFDADSGKMIATDLNVQGFYSNYFTAENSESKTEYYTYQGAKFYTSAS